MLMSCVLFYEGTKRGRRQYRRRNESETGKGWHTEMVAYDVLMKTQNSDVVVV